MARSSRSQVCLACCIPGKAGAQRLPKPEPAAVRVVQPPHIHCILNTVVMTQGPPHCCCFCAGIVSDLAQEIRASRLGVLARQLPAALASSSGRVHLEAPPSGQRPVQAADTVEQPHGRTQSAEGASAADQPQSRQQAAEAASFAEQPQRRAAEPRRPSQGATATMSTGHQPPSTLPPPTPETSAAGPARAGQGHSNSLAPDAEGSSSLGELPMRQLCAAAWLAQPCRALRVRQRAAQLQRSTVTATSCTPGYHRRRLLCSLQALLPALGASRSLAVQQMAVELQEHITCQKATDQQLLSLWRHCAEARQAASTATVAALHAKAGSGAAGGPEMGSARCDVGSLPHVVEAVSSIPALRSAFADAEPSSDDEYAAQEPGVVVPQSASRLRGGTLACAGRHEAIQQASSMPSELDIVEPLNSQRLVQGTGAAGVRNTSVHSVMPRLAHLLASADSLAWSVSSGELPDDIATEL